MTQEQEQEKFDQWAIVELMGHVRMAGRVTEEPRFGTALGRIDIPTDDGFVTQYFGGSSVYRVSPCSEEVARSAAKHNKVQPVHHWELPAKDVALLEDKNSDYDDEEFFSDEE
ncbi:MAG TPA: hypothetical protein V6C76_11435 [Drouetiella sp.]